eukprot:1157315-Pelagomonas_calceolata.AAC.3
MHCCKSGWSDRRKYVASMQGKDTTIQGYALLASVEWMDRYKETHCWHIGNGWNNTRVCNVSIFALRKTPFQKHVLKEQKGKSCASQVLLHAIRKGTLTSKRAWTSPKRLKGFA